jgi:hypothetical protein
LPLFQIGFQSNNEFTVKRAVVALSCIFEGVKNGAGNTHCCSYLCLVFVLVVIHRKYSIITATIRIISGEGFKRKKQMQNNGVLTAFSHYSDGTFLFSARIF